MFNKPLLLTPSKVLITGASGLVGVALTSFLQKKGHVVGKVVRKRRGEPNEVLWDSKTGEGDLSLFEGWDVVVHLAGESLAKGFWTKEKKRKILESREVGTLNLVRVLDSLKTPPKLFISASAVGYYGDRQGAITEESTPGQGFLPTVCLAWETAAKSLKNQGVRVVVARFGYILSSKGGFFKTMRSLFLWGLGGKMGGGEQFLPWITIDDLLRAIEHIIEKQELYGAVNLVSPEPVRQKVFAKTLAKLLRRPCIFSLPKRILLGEKAKALITPSLEVYPVKLQKTGFVFKTPGLLEAFKSLI